MDQLLKPYIRQVLSGANVQNDELLVNFSRLNRVKFEVNL